MPGNTVKINNFDRLEWYIGDNKIEELITWLDDNGIKQSPYPCYCQIPVGKVEKKSMWSRILKFFS